MSAFLERIRQWWARQTPRMKSVMMAVGVMSLYVSMTLITTWPAVTCLSTCIAGYSSGDQPIVVWGFWYGEEALLKGQNPAFLSTLNYPNGYFSAVRLAMLTIPMLVLPLNLLLPPIVVYNLVFLLSFALTGFAGYLLCHDITQDWRGALLGGMVLMLFPLRVAHAFVGHIEIACLFIPVIYVILLRRTVLKPSYRLAFFTGLVLALASMSFVTTPAYFLIPWTALYLAGLTLCKHEQLKNRFTWLALGIVGLVAIAVTLPFFLPLIQAALRPSSEVGAGGVSAYSADLLGYISPPPGNPILDKLGLIPSFARDGRELQETTAYLGLIPVSLAVFALIRRERETGIWLAIALTAVVFALGPYLKVAGEQVVLDIEGVTSPIIMPYAVLNKLPVYSIARDPGRFNLLTGMALSVLAAQGMTVWLRKQRGRRTTIVLSAVIAGVVAEYLVGWPIAMTSDGLFPPTIEALSKEPPTGGVLNVPLRNYWVKLWGAYYQIEHGWPTFDGSYARPIPDTPGRLEMLDWITTRTTPGDIIPAISPGTTKALLAQEGADYILLHHPNVKEWPEIESHLVSLLGEPIAIDASISLYQIEAKPDASEMLYALGIKEGWGWIEEWDGEPARWLTDSDDLIIYSPREMTGVLSFRSLAGDRPRHLTITPENGVPRTLIIAQYMKYTLPDVKLRAGYNVLSFEVEEPCWNITVMPQCTVSQPLTGFSPGDNCWLPPQGQRCIDILFQDIRFEPSLEEVDYHSLSVPLGQDIELVGYRSESSQIKPNSTLTLTLVWQALGNPPEDYHLFIHILDPDSGEPIAQYDGSPLGGAFPTSYWKSGDIVQMKITLQIPGDTHQGMYAVLAGMYSYPSIERLAVNSDRPYAENNLIWLQDLEVVAP